MRPQRMGSRFAPAWTAGAVMSRTRALHRRRKHRTRRRHLAILALTCVSLIAASCSPGDSASTDTEAPSSETAAATAGTEAPTGDTPASTDDTEAPPDDTEAPTEDTAAPSGDTTAPTTEPRPSRPELTTEPVQLKILMEAGGGAFDLLELLGEEFSRQHPNVTFEYQKESFDNLLINGPRALTSDNPPNVIYFPQMGEPAKDGLLLNLEKYFDEFGWDEFSPSQLVQLRVSDDGVRGSGTLYGLGAGYSVTGVVFNRELAAQIGMDEPPKDLDEFDSILARAKESGILPIISFSPATFVHQYVLNQYMDPNDILDFIFLVPGATIDTPEGVAAAERVARWVEADYLNEDVNSLDYFDHITKFVEGDALFMFNGSWVAAELDKRMPGNAGFFVMPPLVEGNPPVTMGAPYTLVIPATSKNPDVTAYFLDWIHRDTAARQLIADINGMSPGGPTSLPPPDAEPGSLVEQMQQEATRLAADGVVVDFLGNATPGFFPNTLIPEVQRLVGGQTKPVDFSRALQEGYEISKDE